MRFIPLLLALHLTSAADTETDFSTAPGTDWQRFDPLGSASISFANGECRLECPAPPLEVALQAGLARAGLFAPEVFTDSVASVDLTGFSPTTSRAADGCFPTVMTRIQTPASIGAVGAYGLSIIDLGNGSAQLQLHRLDNETPVLLAEPAAFVINQSEIYRLVLISRGSTHTGRIYLGSDLTQPLAQISATDTTYPSGRTGLSVSTDRLTGIFATFDNFLAWNGTPPPLAASLSGSFLLLESPANRSLASFIEETADLSLPADQWDASIPGSTTVVSGKMTVSIPMNGPARFFRRRGF